MQRKWINAWTEATHCCSVPWHVCQISLQKYEILFFKVTLFQHIYPSSSSSQKLKYQQTKPVILQIFTFCLTFSLSTGKLRSMKDSILHVQCLQSWHWCTHSVLPWNTSMGFVATSSEILVSRRLALAFCSGVKLAGFTLVVLNSLSRITVR